MTNDVIDAPRVGRRPSSMRRALVVFVVVLAVEVLLALVVVAWVLTGARRDLLQARDHVSAGRTAVAALDLDAAEASFTDARMQFGDASAGLRNPVVRVLRSAPVVGRDLHAVTALAVAGEKVSGAAADVLGAVNDQPDGLASLLPSDGRFPVDRLAAFADQAAAAEQQLADAAATVDAAPADGLVAQVALARAAFAAEVGEVQQLVGSAARASRALSSFMGVDGPRRYLFGAQNPAELRGTGGYIGAYAVATFDRGAFELSRFRPVQQLTSLPISDVPPPNADYAARYNRYGGAGFWQAINATPDFPSAAQAMVGLYDRTQGVALDGVIVVDPFVLEALLRLVGDVRIPELGRVGPDEVVSVISVEAREEFASNETRKETLGAIAGAALKRLLDDAGSLTPTTVLDTFVPVLRDRHLLLYSVDPSVQAAWRDLRFAGALPEPDHDALAVVVNNAAVSKVDFYMERAVDYRVQLHDDGSASGRLRVTFTNAAPASAPVHAVGADGGDNLSLVSIFCGRCDPTRARPKITKDDVRSGMFLEQELGHTVASTLLRIPRGAERTVMLSWDLEDAWSPHTDGCYMLDYAAQPTVRATDLAVSVVPPDGWVRGSGEHGGTGARLHSGRVDGLTRLQACYAPSDGA